MNREQAPLYEKMIAHFQRGTASFHVPGHKSGAGADQAAAAIFGPIMAVDYTEISGLDDLHQPEGAIAEAERLAAACFGADETYFLVGGSTAGNLAMIAAVCERDDVLLVQRNCHKSVLHGLMLAGAKAVFLTPQPDPLTGIAVGVTASQVEEALRAYPHAKGLLVTNPNYYGMSARLDVLADVLHQAGKPLLVDEAHGAHFGFHPALPPSALSQGADIVVQSTHKMMTAMTMGAMLHVQGGRIDRPLLRSYLAMLQSSSPSYPIMASLDLARRQMDTEGRRLIDNGLAAVETFCGLMRRLSAFDVMGGVNARGKAFAQDPFKVLAADRTGTLTGYELRDELEKAGCFCELAEPGFVLLVFSMASSTSDASRLYAAFQTIYDDFRLNKQELPSQTTNIYNLTPNFGVSASVSFDLSSLRTGRPTERVALDQAHGRIAAEMVIPYPPGIPLLYPGELITEDTAQTLLKLAQSGARFHGFAPSERLAVAVLAPQTNPDDHRATTRT